MICCLPGCMAMRASASFEYRVTALSPQGELKADDWLGKALAITLAHSADKPDLHRVLHGYVCGFRRLADEGQLLRYEFLLRP